LFGIEALSSTALKNNYPSLAKNKSTFVAALNSLPRREPNGQNKREQQQSLTYSNQIEYRKGRFQRNFGVEVIEPGSISRPEALVNGALSDEAQ
jgi:hypothetical protein